MRIPLLCAAILWSSTAHVAAAGAAMPMEDDPALAAIEACRARLDARADVGLERIEKRCPDLLSRIEQAPWAALVPADLRTRRDELSAEGLRALVELIRGANQELAARPAPDVERLTPLLSELGAPGQQGATRWERFKRWLKEKLERRAVDDESSWLEELGRQFETSEGVARFITYVGYAALGALVIAVIASELRAAGVLGGRRRAERRLAAQAVWRRRLQLSDIAQAPLAERPGMLLRLLGEALTRTHRLPAADGMTSSAIVRRAKLDDEADRADLRHVADTAETVRFGASLPGEEALASAIRAATSLLERLTLPASGRR
jgi:hypothetical protein